MSSGEIDTVIAALPDMYARLVGKRFTARHFLDRIAGGGTNASEYLLGCDVDMDPLPGQSFTKWQRGYGDFVCVPDPATFRILPWLPKTALVLCDVKREDGAPIEVAPRRILQRQLEKAAAIGLVPMGASELEFYVFRETFETARRKRFHDLETYGKYIEDYQILPATREEPLVRAIRNGMEAARVPIESSKAEGGPGQHEINIEYCGFLETSDRHVIFKHGVKEIASHMGLAVTFMAKWHEAYAGSSCHVHSSLWTPLGEPLFHDPRAPAGMSAVFRHWLAGLLAHARELALFFAPYVNSYKRYESGSFAPTRVVWSSDNRSAGFRVVGRGRSMRVENRMPGADANPYLAFAATLAAGIDGIERRLELPPPYEGDAYDARAAPTLPSSIGEAIDELARSGFARAAFGDDIVDHYLQMARNELRKFSEVVTCWELARHFERT